MLVREHLVLAALLLLPEVQALPELLLLGVEPFKLFILQPLALIIEKTLLVFQFDELLLRLSALESFEALLLNGSFWIDVASVAPLYIDAGMGRTTKYTIVSRLFRLLKPARHHVGARILTAALALSLRALLVPMLFAFAGVTILAGLLWLLEEGGEASEDFEYIPQASDLDVVSRRGCPC